MPPSLFRGLRSPRSKKAASFSLFLGASAIVWAAACANSTFDPADDGSVGGAAGAAGAAGASGVGGGAAAGKGGKSGASGAGTGGDAGQSGAGGKGGAGGKAGAGQAGSGGAAGKGGSASGGKSGSGGSASGAGGLAGTGGTSAGGAGKSGASGSAGSSGQGGAAGSGGAAGKGGAAGSGGTTAGAAGSPPAGLCVYDPAARPDQDECFGCWNQALDSETCSNARNACDADPNCAAFFQCVVTCGGEDSSCEKTCAKDTTIASGKVLYESLRDCITDEKCSPACDAHAQEILTLDMCKHDVCTSGMILYKQCSEGAAQICSADATCCGGPTGKWDSSCIAKAESAGFCPNEGCVHSPCAPGAPIVNKTCSPCVDAICDQYPHCCQPTGKWDATCATAVTTVCADL
jgi:hypothetical protein